MEMADYCLKIKGKKLIFINQVFLIEINEYGASLHILHNKKRAILDL